MPHSIQPQGAKFRAGCFRKLLKQSRAKFGRIGSGRQNEAGNSLAIRTPRQDGDTGWNGSLPWVGYQLDVRIKTKRSFTCVGADRRPDLLGTSWRRAARAITPISATLWKQLGIGSTVSRSFEDRIRSSILMLDPRRRIGSAGAVPPRPMHQPTGLGVKLQLLSCHGQSNPPPASFSPDTSCARWEIVLQSGVRHIVARNLESAEKENDPGIVGRGFRMSMAERRLRLPAKWRERVSYDLSSRTERPISGILIRLRQRVHQAAPSRLQRRTKRSSTRPRTPSAHCTSSAQRGRFAYRGTCQRPVRGSGHVFGGNSAHRVWRLRLDGGRR